ncbi:MAG: type I-U CRISPR-associated protein Csb2 [Gemmataceae bacterium]|nr:type I-U CRISPR-associated protein Csb2 [Gemmataceae bacterium]
MPTVKLRFPGGRYHATPWGHHVNEGLIEWPPCPWRLLRALLAAGFSKLGWIEIPTVGRRLIEKLAAVLPTYRLPAASAAHSRHYMPTIEGKAQKTTLVFDTWANVGDGDLLIYWPCELDAEETASLAKLAAALGYLGRSESWAEAELLPEDTGIDWNAEPCQEGKPMGPGWEQVSLLAAIPQHEYAQWYEAETSRVLSTIQKPSGKRITAKLQEKYETQCRNALAPYPKDLIECLTKETFWWKGHGWSQPPGSQRVLYWRRSDALQVGVPPARRPVSAKRVKTMLLALSTPSGNRSALPPITKALPQAEWLHRAIIGNLANGQRVSCPEITGRDEFGRPLRANHKHAHTIPLDLDSDGRIDHFLVLAEMGLGEEAQRAIRRLRRTWTRGFVGDLQLAVVGSGDLENLRCLPPPLLHQIEELLGPPGGATIWESVTPFVPPRTLDRRRKRTVVGQVNAELACRGLPEADSVVIYADLTRSLRHFARRRYRGRVSPKVDFGFGLRLEFAQPIKGPLLLGYASHYGLGLFRTVAGGPLVDVTSNNLAEANLSRR